MPRKRRDVPWLEFRANGYAYANWYDADTGRTNKQSLDTKDPKEAAIAFGHFLIEGPRSKRASSLHGLTVWQAIDDYLREHVEQVDDKGRPYVIDQSRQHAIAAHLKAYFDQGAPLHSVGVLESRGYVAARRAGIVGGGKRRKEKKGADATVRRELNMLVAAANHAVKWKRLTLADLPQIELPTEERGAEVMWLTKEQLAEALSRAAMLAQKDEPTVIETHLHDFVLLAYYTAARKRSIEKLTKFQVDLANGRINLMPPGARTTKKRKPVVPIYDEIRPAIERLMETPGGYLFGGAHDFYRQFRKLMAGMGIEAHPHMLRHSRATHMLHDGEDIYKVARLLGDTLTTVDRVYAHSSPEFLATSSGVRRAD